MSKENIEHKSKEKEDVKKGKLEIKSVPPEQVETMHEMNNTFFSTQTHFEFDGRYLTMDFQRVSPRTSQGKIVTVIEHNAVMMDIFHAKDFADKFSMLIKAIENQFGNVEMPEFMKKIKSETQSQLQKIMQESARGKMEGVTAKDHNEYIG